MRYTHRQKDTSACLTCPLRNAKHVNSWYVPTEITEVNDRVDILFIGEGPGKTEDAQCMPFVGASGQLLRKLIRHAFGDLDVGIAFSYIVRCNSCDAHGNNRAPNEDEIKCCRGYIEQDIIDINPKAIVLLGGTSMWTFFEGDQFVTVGSARGNAHEIEIQGKTFPVIVTYHPVAALRNPNLNTLLQEDFNKALKVAHNEVDNRSGRPGKHTILMTMPEVLDFYDFLQNDAKGIVTFDTETKNLNKRYDNQLVTMQFGNDAMIGYVVPYMHREAPWSIEQFQKIKQRTARLFTEPVNFDRWVAHNAQFDLCQVKRDVGVWIRSKPIVDTMVMAYLLNENRLALKQELQGKVWSLKGLAYEYLGFVHYRDEDLAVRSAGDLWKLPLQQLGDYGAMDAYVTWRLYQNLMERAEQQKYQKKIINLAENLFGRAALMFAALEMNGMMIDMDHLRVLRSPDSPIRSRMQEIILQLNDMPSVKKANKAITDKSSCGMVPIFGEPWEFDIGKRDHLKELFFEVLGVEPIVIGPTGPKMDKSFLKVYAKYDAAEEPTNEAGLIKEFREMQKLDSSYTNQIFEFVRPGGSSDCKDGRVRPSFGLTNTVTGRPSCNGPNLQQIPRGDNPAKKSIKNMFSSEPGTCLVQLDYSTNEIRWLCLVAKDPALAKAFNAGKLLRDTYRKNPTPEMRDKAQFEGDLHRQTASTFFGVHPSKVTYHQRNAAKSIVFGLIYGRHYASIADQIGVTKQESKNLCEQFFAQFPKSAQWLEFIQKFAEARHFVESPIGRRRRLEAFIGSDKGQINQALRQARNSPIQGVASDACLLGAAGMIEYIIDNNLEDRWLGTNVVHDSFVAQIPIEEVSDYVKVAEEQFTTQVMRCMNDHWDIDFFIPLEVDFDIGIRWGNLRGWDYTSDRLNEILNWVKEEDQARS